MRRLEQLLRRHHLPATLVRLVGHAVLGQRLILIDEGEVLGLDPPPPEPRLPCPIPPAAEARAVEDAMELRGGNAFAAHPVEHRGRAPAVLRSEVVLVVAVGDPAVVNRSEFGPGSGVGNPPVGHPPLHPEQRFDGVLLGLSGGDLVLGHAEPVEDGQQLLGAEDAPAVGH